MSDPWGLCPRCGVEFDERFPEPTADEIERVARAIRYAWNEHKELLSWDGLSEEVQDKYRDCSRAAILAMRGKG